MGEANRQTKIIITYGPACADKDQLKKVIEAGADVIRLNASHFNEAQEIENAIKVTRTAAKELGKNLGIFLDLQGPKIRVGNFKNKTEILKEGSTFTFVKDSAILGDETQSGVSYPELIDDLGVGEQVFINDGKIQLEVTEKKPGQAICKVIRGGEISNHKGINLPTTNVGISPITEKDKRDLIVALKNDLEYVALSFVSTAKDIQDLRKLIKANNGNPDTQIIAKIERRNGVTNIESILEEADIIMVARGDLGVEVGIEKVPEIQKQLIMESVKYIKPVIVATQMLESMVTSKIATRAEVSDVANAIYDGCDAVMLSGETATGIDPENAVATMRNIAVATDKHVSTLKTSELKYSLVKKTFKERTMPSIICKSADQVAEAVGANSLMAFTSSGSTALIASKLNPSIPIIAPTDNPKVMRKMSLYRGVTPMLMPVPFTDITKWTDMINIAIEDLKRGNVVKEGQTIVVLAGIPIGFPGGTNSIRLIKI